MGSKASAVYAFDRFVLHLERGALLADGVERALRPKSFALLRHFVENPGRVIDRDEIMHAVWPGVFVSDDSIAQCVRDIRRALGDDQQLLLRTLPRRGYLLTAQVARGTEQPASSASAEIAKTVQPIARPPPLIDKPSIAVLPFQNMPGDQEQEYFVDGMVEEIITALSRIRWLFVIARNSSFTYKGQSVDVKQAGRELGVRYVLEGSVRKGGGRVLITGQLIDAVTGTHLWADRFDGSLEDVFELQDKVAISVAGVIEPTLRQSEIERARRKRPDSLDAYDLYLRALPCAVAAMPEDADKALPLLGKAIELEPDFAAAHAMIAWCHEQRYLRGGMQEETKNAALRHARQAIAAGGDDAVALATAGFVIAVASHDYETALTAFERSFALSNSSALALGFSAIVRAWKGDDAEAIEQAELAIRLSPFDPLIYLPCVGLAYAH